MMLQLAEPYSQTRYSAGRASPPPRKRLKSTTDDEPPYIYIPNFQGGAGYYVREDYFDFLSPDEWRTLMAQLAPYQPAVQAGMSEPANFLADRASRKKKREEKQQGKTDKNARKNKRNEAKNKLIEARAKAKAEGKGGDILGSITSGLTSIFGGGAAGGAGVAPDAGGGGGGAPPPDEEEKWYQKPIVWVGGALGVGAIIYFATRKN